jgi:hypothetical protein
VALLEERQGRSEDAKDTAPTVVEPLEQSVH